MTDPRKIGADRMVRPAPKTAATPGLIGKRLVSDTNDADPPAGGAADNGKSKYRGSNTLKRLLLLFVVMAGLSSLAAALSVTVLYQTSLSQQRARLTVLAQSQARLIESIARLDGDDEQPADPSHVIARAMSPVIDSHERYKGFGQTGEFTLGRHVGDRIIFLLNHRHYDLANPRPVAWTASVAEPMRRALKGQSGTVVALDYRGEEVLAAYEPVAGLQLGIVAKIDLSEIRAPFVRAGAISAFGVLGVFLLGAVIFRLVGAPLIEREKTQQLIREQTAIINQIEEAVIATDLDGIVTEWNDGAERLWGYKSEEVVGRHHGFLYAADEPQSPEHEITETLKSVGSYVRERRFRRASGEIFTGTLSLTLFRDTRAEPVAMVAFVTDVTALKQAQAALHQAQKMEAVGQLTGGIAHDFNNLLMIIQGNLEMLRENLERGDILDDMTARALRAARRGAKLTHRLLAFARHQPLQTEVLTANELIADMTEILTRSLSPGIVIETDLEAGLWAIEVDRNQLENALLNLALNARDAMGDAGGLTITTRNLTIEPLDRKADRDLPPGDYIVMTVGDSGTGIAPRHIAQVFEPFFTTKGVGEGSGLGLSMVYGFIKQSGGHVEIESALGRGTRVILYLPRADREPAAKVPPARRQLPPPETGDLVLVVEDDPEVRKLAVAAVSSLGYRVIEAADGRHALDLIEATPDVRLLFTEVMLPGDINGAALARGARKRRVDLKIVYTSGVAREALPLDGEPEDDGTALLIKPYTRVDLGATLASVLSPPLRPARRRAPAA